MHEKDPLLPTVEPHGRLECKEIWQGIRSRDIELSAGKAIGSNSINEKGVSYDFD